MWGPRTHSLRDRKQKYAQENDARFCRGGKQEETFVTVLRPHLGDRMRAEISLRELEPAEEPRAAAVDLPPGAVPFPPRHGRIGQ